MSKKRKQYSPTEKVSILRGHFVDSGMTPCVVFV